jgi:hypothetical protein
MNTLSNYDIEDILKHYNLNINGIFHKDDLPNKLKKGFYIINLDKKYNPGTHWTCLYYINPNYSIYFDAMGFYPPAEIEDKLKIYDYNIEQIQNINSSACGFYCIAFIKYMIGKKDYLKEFNNFIDKFNKNNIKNDSVLSEIFNL